MMTEHELLLWLVPAFATVLSLIGMGILNQLRKLTTIIQNLNVKLAVIVERVNHHEGRIKKLESKK